MSHNTSNEEKIENRNRDHLISNDSEFDDALCVPESLEITLNENDDAVNVESKEDTDLSGKFIIIYYFLNFCYIH